MNKKILTASCLFLSSGLFGSLSVNAADIEPPKVQLVDKFGVNMANGQVTHSLPTVSIGGAMGLSDSISVYANEFNFPANRGFNYKYYAWARNVEFCSQLDACSPRNVMRAHDGDGSADFAYYVNGVIQQTGDATSNYTYVAVGDARHTLEAVGNLFKWTKPDGTIVTFDRGATSPMPANDDGYLTTIEYPNGYTVTVTLAGVSVNTNTGFQLKNVYEMDTRPSDKPVVPPPRTSAASGWSARNPKYVYGVNAAVEHCDWTATTCAFSRDWPHATFDWAPGMPDALRSGTTQASVTNAQGIKTTYGFTAQDLAYNEFGALMPGQTAGQEFSPRLTSVSAPNNANVPRVTYDYKNLFVNQSYGFFGSFDYRLQTAGVTKTASRGPLQATYSINDPTQGSDVRNTGGSINGMPEVHVRGNVAGTVGAINYADTPEGRMTFEMSARNFPYHYQPNTGPRQVMTYDARGNLTKITYNGHLPEGYYIEAEYPASCTSTNRKTCNQATRIRDGNGNWTDYEYHADSGQVARITYPANKQGIRPETRFEYEALHAHYFGSDGNWTEGSAIWLKTEERYCINREVASGACSGGEVVTGYEYNHPNLLMSGMTITADGVTRRTCYRYDIYGNQIGVTTPNANLASCPAEDEPADELPQVAAAFAHATRYNVSGQVTGTLAPDPDSGALLRHRATRNTYGPANTATAGLLIKTETGELAAWASQATEPSAWSGFTVYLTKTYSYDSQGRKTAERVIGTTNGTIEALTQYSYDDWDRVQCRVVRMNKDSFAAPPTSACEPGSEGADGPDRITRYTYNEFDQVLTEERAVETAEAQTYVINQYELGSRQLRFQTDARGNKTELRYDANGRLWKRFYPSASVPGSVNQDDFNEYRYDANGNVIFERKRNEQTITSSFDAHNRLVFKNLSDNTYSGDVSYGYDLRGLTLYSCFGTELTSSCDTSGEGETNAFDGFGNVISRKSRMNGITRELTYQYDLEGNRTRVTHPDGYFFQYAFDGLNRFNSLQVSLGTTPASSTGAGLALKYRPSGGREEISRAGTNAAVTTIAPDNALRLKTFLQDFANDANNLLNTFTYNAASQVTGLTQTNTAYNYREADNRVGGYSANGLNQYTLIEGRVLEYDTSGNLTKDRVSDGTLSTYTYDMENHLVAVAGPLSGNLTYDALGRLSRLLSGGSSTQFLYDGDALVAEYLNGTLTRRFVHGDQVDEPLIQYHGTNLATRRYLHADHQGSIIAHSDTAGAVTQKNAYDPYGIPASTNDGRFGYTGQAWLKELGLNYYKARIYSPRLGRFLQTDPIFYKDDMNLYAYVGNDPLNKRDPSGQKCTGTGDNSKCTIDEIKIGTRKNANGKKVDVFAPLTQGMRNVLGRNKLKQINRLEASITDSYKRAQRAGTTPVTVQGRGNIADTQVTGAAVASALGGDRGQGGALLRAGATSDGANARTNPDTPTITFTSASQKLASDDQQITALHEGLHLLSGTSAWNPVPGQPFDQNFHRDSFDEAAHDIFDLGK